MILVIAPTYTIARNVAEIDFKLRRPQWRYVREPHDIQGYTAEGNFYILYWPRDFESGGRLLSFQATLRSAGIPSYRESYEPPRGS